MQSSVKAVGMAIALLVSAAAHAKHYEFGTLMSGTGPTNADFASLDIMESNTSTWQFTLTLDQDMATYFGNTSFAGAIAVDLGGAFTHELITSVSGSGSGWVPEVSTSKGGGPTGIYSFRFVLQHGSDKMMAGDKVTWDVTFEGAGNKLVTPTLFADSFALHVQNTKFCDGSAWYKGVPTVPEPETWALLGMGLVAATAAGWRERRKTATPV